MRRFICVIGAAAIATTLFWISTLQAQSPDGNWPMFHHDAQRTGKSPLGGPLSCGLKWSYRVGSDVYSSPVLGEDGSTYLGSYDNNIYCFTSGGTMLWSYTTDDNIQASPGFHDEALYLGSMDNCLYVITSAGTLDWSYMTGNDIDHGQSPVTNDEAVWNTSDDGNIYCLQHNGQFSWSYELGSFVNCAPSLDGVDTVYIGSSVNRFFSLSSNGSFVWSYRTAADIFSAAAVSSDHDIYLGCMDNHLYSLNSVGALRWSYETGDPIQFGMTAAVSTNVVYIGSDDNNLYCLNQNGALSWSYSTASGLQSSPALSATDTVFLGSQDSKVYCISSTGSLIWSYDTGATIYSSPAIDSRSLYIGSFDSRMYVLSEQTSTPIPPTPTMTPTPTVTFPPGLRVWPNKTSFRAGETLEIWVSFTDTYVDWDGYLVIAGIGKEWSVMSPFTLKRGIHALVKDGLEMHFPGGGWGPEKVFSTVVPFGVSGNYTIYCATLMAGLKPTMKNALKPLCQLATTTFTVR
ncbi:MAG: PQQ-binding-like beta-propeller repeat protein [Candidatus Aureabacteria bacterium]|nr:PQQ-binding-like beta-propeller repeat protein [Candidatus Auribacterota bacterium]